MVGWHHQLNGRDLSKLQEMVKDKEAWHAAVHRSQRLGHDLVTEQQIYKTTYSSIIYALFLSSRIEVSENKNFFCIFFLLFYFQCLEKNLSLNKCTL